jgi:hypothetical protein
MRQRLDSSLGPGDLLGVCRIGDTDCRIIETVFASNGRVCLLAILPDGMVYTKLSSNVPEVDLAAGEFAVPVHNLGKDVVSRLIYAGIGIEDTGFVVVSGFVEMPVLRLTRGEE